MKLVRLLILDLSIFEHLINKLLLMSQEIILSSPVLDSFTNLRIHVFTVGMHILISGFTLLLSLSQDVRDKVFVENYLLNHVRCLLVSFYVIHKDVVREGEMLE